MSEDEAGRQLVERAYAALDRLKKDETWEAWLEVGRALQWGRDRAMRFAGTNDPVGKGYNIAFGRWLDENKRLGEIDKGDRSRLMAVLDNLPAIEAWRMTLTWGERQRLNHPSTVLRKWQAATKVKPPKDPNPEPKGLRAQVARLEEEKAVLERKLAEEGSHIDLDDTAEEIVAALAGMPLGKYRQVVQAATRKLRELEAKVRQKAKEPKATKVSRGIKLH